MIGLPRKNLPDSNAPQKAAMKHSYSRGDHGPQEFTVMHLQNDESNTSQIAVLNETQKKEPEK